MVKYLATRLNGDGTETILHRELPILGGTGSEELSGPGGLTGSIEPEHEELEAPDGAPLFEPWSTAIYAIEGNAILAGGILVEPPTEAGPKLSLDLVGHTVYAAGQPFTGDYSTPGEDPLNVARLVWSHLQSKRDGNLGLTLDPTTSTARIGKPASNNTDNDGPFTLAWWKDHDLGKVFDDLAANTPFEYLLAHRLEDGLPKHHLRLGWPQIGRRRRDVLFVVGENVSAVPELSATEDEYASNVIVLGAGEGRQKIRGESPYRPGRLRRTAVVIRSDITKKTVAEKEASRELAYRLGEADFTQLDVLDHPNARAGSYAPGDEVRVRTAEGWSGRSEIWVRILARDVDYDTGQTTVTVTRAEKAAG